MFGVTGSKRSEQYMEWGIKKRTNAQAREQYRAEVTQIMGKLGLKEPDPLKDRRFL
jgi:1,2-phenylacetyl-CoA epoxidase catalytic subunit